MHEGLQQQEGLQLQEGTSTSAAANNSNIINSSNSRDASSNSRMPTIEKTKVTKIKTLIATLMMPTAAGILATAGTWKPQR